MRSVEHLQRGQDELQGLGSQGSNKTSGVSARGQDYHGECFTYGKELQKWTVAYRGFLAASRRFAVIAMLLADDRINIASDNRIVSCHGRPKRHQDDQP